ncbi:MAG: phenylalanine--tRNA ligase subunit beta [Bacteroidota bacterium]
MKISYNWLKQYTGVELPTAEISKILTDCGLEVEGIEHEGIDKSRLKGVVVGYVTEKTKHPNADKLSLTKVDVGQGEPLSVVCGAANVAQGQKVLVATIGTHVITSKGEFVIQKSTIRGETSEGMICAEDELGLGDSHAGIMVLDADAPIGMPAAEYLNAEEDFVFEIGLTPNRSDATSHIGVARDLIACINARGNNQLHLVRPDVSAFTVADQSLNIKVIIEDTLACPRYTGLTMTGVRVTDSPAWLQTRLRNIGVRPINNIVDITNFVLFETGQPLHAFDADAISGKKVIIKKYPEKTKFITLDGVERELSANDLMISNANEPMCIAGVFGGEKSGITTATQNIFLESAYFNPSSVRKTSKLHGLKTDASFRFERGADPEITVYAIKRAALLIAEIAGGKVSMDISDVYPEKIANRQIEFSLSYMDKVIGKHIDKEIVKNILLSLGIIITADNGEVLSLEVPPFKTDVTRPIDVVEEVLRVYGYNNIEFGDGMKASLSYFPKPDPEKVQNTISDYLTSLGFFEILTNSLTKEAYYEKNSELFDPSRLVRILNPLSKELNVMRQTLLFSGLESVAYNKNHKTPNTLFYEFGRIYFRDSEKAEALDKYSEFKRLALFLSGNIQDANWHTKEQSADLYYLKAMVANILRRAGIACSRINITDQKQPLLFSEQINYAVDGKLLCDMGELQTDLLKQNDIKDSVFYASIHWDTLLECIDTTGIKYKEVCRFPEVTRDLALLIDKQVDFGQIEAIAYKTEPALIRKVSLFDVYEGKNIDPGKKSYAVNFILQDEEKTLTDEQIDACMNKLIAAYTKQINAQLR